MRFAGSRSRTAGARGAALQRKIASSQGAARIRIIDALLAMSVAQEPACLPVLERERRAAVELVAANEHAPQAVRALASLKRTLYPYQRESVLRFLGAGSLLIADDMGLGKTTQAVAAGHALLTCGAVARVLLVVPASLKAQWCREWQASTTLPIECHKPLEESATILMRIRKDRPLTKAERERLMMLLGEQRRVCNGLVQCDFEARWPELRQQTPSESLLSSLDAPKLLAFRDLIRELVVHQRRKVVVFSEWRAMLRLAAWSVSDLLGDAGLESGFFTGAESPKLRERALVDFHDRPEMAALFLTDAGGVGLNLQRAASACVQLELPWNPAVMEQPIGRIHRLGQTQPIDVFHVVSEGGIESKIAGLLGRKAALCTALPDQDGAPAGRHPGCPTRPAQRSLTVHTLLRPLRLAA